MRVCCMDDCLTAVAYIQPCHPSSFISLYLSVLLQNVFDAQINERTNKPIKSTDFLCVSSMTWVPALENKNFLGAVNQSDTERTNVHCGWS